MRILKRAAAALVLLIAVAPLPAGAQTGNADIMKLGVAGPLGDMSLGDPKAPVHVVEYASMTCSHCARFANNTFDAFKTKYIDTGRVHFTLREFPLDSLSGAAFMLARCAPKDQYFPLVALLFKEQENWAFSPNPGSALFKLVEPMGFDQTKFEACVTDQKLLDHVTAVRKRAADEFHVDATPTFFFNGTFVSGALSIEKVDEMMATMP